MSDLERLARLQELDSAIDHMAYRRAHLEERVAWKAVSAELAAARSAVAANAALRSRLEEQYAALERAGADLDAKRRRLEQQMKSIVVTREAEALQREIDLLVAERNETDEQGLGLLDESEQASITAATLEAAVGSCEVADRSATEALAVADAELDGELAGLTAERGTVVEAIDPALVQRYDSMRTSFKGVAVARLQGSRCTGCHLDLSRVELEAVKAVPAGEIPECPQCARILVR